MPGWRRRIRRQGQPSGDSELQRDQVDPVHALGDRVLDLQPGVELEEVELPVADEELGGAGAEVAHRARDRCRRREQPGAQRLRHRWGRRLLDDLLVPPLHRAVAFGQRPDRAVGIGEDLHLDVPGAGQQRLAEQRAVAEGRLGLAAG